MVKEHGLKSELFRIKRRKSEVLLFSLLPSVALVSASTYIESSFLSLVSTTLGLSWGWLSHKISGPVVVEFNKISRKVKVYIETGSFKENSPQVVSKNDQYTKNFHNQLQTYDYNQQISENFYNQLKVHMTSSLRLAKNLYKEGKKEESAYELMLILKNLTTKHLHLKAEDPYLKEWFIDEFSFPLSNDLLLNNQEHFKIMVFNWLIKRNQFDKANWSAQEIQRFQSLLTAFFNW